MSQYNGVGEGGLNDILVRRLSVTGGAPVASVAPEIFPNLVLENDRPEWGYLKGEYWFARGLFVAASGGAGFSGAELWNRAGANTLVVVRKIVATQSAGSLRFGTSISPTGPAGTVVRGVSLDTRFSSAASTRSSAAELHSRTDYTDPAALAFFGPSGVGTFELEFPVVLKPGATLFVINDTANTAISRINLLWTERQAQPGELA